MSAWHASSAIYGQDYKLPAVSTVSRAKSMQSKQLKAVCLSSMIADDGYYDPKNYLHYLVILITRSLIYCHFYEPSA
jgi:hypothetical protein